MWVFWLIAAGVFFIIEMAYAGIFSLNVPQEHLEPVLMIEAPHLLFPYAREAISSVMYNGGLTPIVLSPLDFVAMYKSRKAQGQNAANNN